MSKDEYAYKRKAIRAAKDLCYPSEIITRLKNATTEIEIERIMATARKEM